MGSFTKKLVDSVSTGINEALDTGYERFGNVGNNEYPVYGQVKSMIKVNTNETVPTMSKLISNTKMPLKIMVLELDIFNPPPPLVLLINPNTFDIKFQAKIVEQRVRWKGNSGYIFHHHHDELIGLSASGYSAMFVVQGTGLTSSERESSLAWTNINQVIAIYRNNGINYSKKPDSKSKGGYIDSVGRVRITYDRVIYIGSFDSFGLTESEDQQFRYAFNFDYKVTKTANIGKMQDSILDNIIEGSNLEAERLQK